jgi:hypothetical protein
MLRIPHCLDSRLTDGGKVVSPAYRPRSTPQKHYSTASGTHLCQRLTKLLDLMRLKRLDQLKNSILHRVSNLRPSSNALPYAPLLLLGACTPTGRTTWCPVRILVDATELPVLHRVPLSWSCTFTPPMRLHGIVINYLCTGASPFTLLLLLLLFRSTVQVGLAVRVWTYI